MLLALAVDRAADEPRPQPPQAAGPPGRSRTVCSVAISSPSSSPRWNSPLERPHDADVCVARPLAAPLLADLEEGIDPAFVWRMSGCGSRRGTVAPAAVRCAAPGPPAVRARDRPSETSPLRVARADETSPRVAPSRRQVAGARRRSPVLSSTSARSPSASRSQARTSGATPKIDRCAPRPAPASAPRRDQPAVQRQQRARVARLRRDVAPLRVDERQPRRPEVNPPPGEASHCIGVRTAVAAGAVEGRRSAGWPDRRRPCRSPRRRTGRRRRAGSAAGMPRRGPAAGPQREAWRALVVVREGVRRPGARRMERLGALDRERKVAVLPGREERLEVEGEVELVVAPAPEVAEPAPRRAGRPRPRGGGRGTRRQRGGCGG